MYALWKKDKTFWDKCQHIQELETQLRSMNEELKENNRHTQELERQLESVNEKLVSAQEQEEALSATVEDLERNVESLRNKLEEERLSKERELQKREKEVAELKKQLASITQELEAEKQKSSPVQEEKTALNTEPTLVSDNLGHLIDELQEVAAEWDSFGIKLEVPYHELEIISRDCGRNAKRCMTRVMKWWLDHDLEANWSTIALALAKIGKRNLAHKIALNHGVPTQLIADVSAAGAAVKERLMKHPSALQKTLMESVDELRSSVRNKSVEVTKQQQVLKEAEHDEDAVRKRLTNSKERMNSHQSRIEKLMEEKMELKKALRFREVEIEILKESAREERAYLIALREEEVAEYQKQLESVEKELEEERQKIPPLKEEIQQLLVELARKSEENRHLRNTWEATNSQLTVERERVEMKTKELTAAAVSHAEHMKEIQMQLASVEESKKKKTKEIRSLQETIKEKETQIQVLSQRVLASEDAAKLQQKEMFMELTDMVMTIIRLQDEVSHLHTAVAFSQEEARCYQERATALLAATRLTLKWSDHKRAPETMKRGAAAVHGTIAYVIGRDSRTIYSYRSDRKKWNKHSICPYTNPGLVIINDQLSAVGGREGSGLTNKLVSFNRTKWVEECPPMQTPRERPAVVYYGDYVVAMGGDREGRGVEVFHIPSLRWSTATSLPISLTNITATLCHDGIIAMDYKGSAYRINMDYLISGIRLEESSTKHSQWISLPECPVYYGPTVATTHGQCLVISRDEIFQLQEGQWVRIGDMSVPRYDCIVCVMCDQMVVVGGRDGSLTSTDAVRVAVIV